MAIYKIRYDRTEHSDIKKLYWNLVEEDSGRDKARAVLAETRRSHYDRLKWIADDVECLGYAFAGKNPKAQIPQTKKGRSGDLYRKIEPADRAAHVSFIL